MNPLKIGQNPYDSVIMIHCATVLQKNREAVFCSRTRRSRRVASGTAIGRAVGPEATLGIYRGSLRGNSDHTWILLKNVETRLK